jgi:hypothetical protein
MKKKPNARGEIPRRSIDKDAGQGLGGDERRGQ